jgi:uncharacterized protein (TIGR03435 family)
VIDMTGLQGAYKIELQWTPNPGESRDSGILAALPQLGLWLEKRTAPYETLVIDHVERVPTSN